VSAIVTIGRDHEIHLGRGLASIAREKAGVMRRGRPTVVGRLPPVAQRAVRAVAARRGARVVEAAARALPRGLDLLPGAHQRDNARVASALLGEARRVGLRFPLSVAQRGMSGARWPGRLQWIAGRPPLLLDGAHNVDGARALAAHVATRGPFVLVFGAMADKDVEAISALLFPLARHLVITRAPGERAAGPEEIARRAGAAARDARRVASPGRALAVARGLAARVDGYVLVAGSLYLVGDVLRRLQRRRRPRK
jgi:dihydrofolate synthase/folylpolyglutamate synthase